MGDYMYKANLKKYLNRFLILLIGVFLIYSIYVQLEYRHYVNQSIDRNYDHLSIIAVKGNNLADRLDEFIHLPIEKEEFSEVKSELYNSWKVVNGESKSIHSYLYAISTLHMGDEASDWELLQFSLFRVEEFIYGMTLKFLEHHSYTISSKEKEKMEAVIKVYRIINEETENDLVDVEIILQSIKEPLLVIDDNYSGTLERLGR
ncbi:hypothetical protein, partial [Halalkalibacter flavus]|uniref:hypothetical protein n=1 Tax=Halalkalibacter flavus TaxID=3090668 RepID=UPI002FCA4B8A